VSDASSERPVRRAAVERLLAELAGTPGWVAERLVFSQALGEREAKDVAAYLRERWDG